MLNLLLLHINQFQDHKLNYMKKKLLPRSNKLPHKDLDIMEDLMPQTNYLINSNV